VIVLRRFELCLPQNEYRLFVHTHTLTGVSQYCSDQHYAQVVQNRAHILAILCNWYTNTLMPLLQYDNAVVDVCVESGDVVRVIEINPFYQVCIF
jgi:hypothetical protein